MKKSLLLIVALMATILTASAVNWDKYDFLGDGAGGGAYSNKYKVEAVDGLNVVNIQQPGFATEAGIYVSVPTGISSCSVSSDIQGAGIILHLSAFTAKETEVTIEHAAGTITFHVFYADGTGEVNNDPNTDPDPDPEQKDPNVLTNGSHTVTLTALHYTDRAENNYVLTITSTEQMVGLGGSYAYVNGAAGYYLNGDHCVVSEDGKTITITFTSTEAPQLYTPLYVLMPGEVNFGQPTFNWVDTTATAINAVESNTINNIFNLNGAKLQRMQHGINIVNGRKVVIK